VQTASRVNPVAASRAWGVPALTTAAQAWLLRAGAVLLPLVYWPPTYDSYVLPKLLMARALVLALAALLVIRWLASGVIAFKRTPIDLPLLAFVGSAVLSAIAGINVNIGIFGSYTRYDGALTLITYAALFWLAIQSIEDSDAARGLLRAMLAGGSLVALVAIGQWLRDTFLGIHVPRAYGTLGNANVLGAYLVMLMPAAYHELRAASSIETRLLAANTLVVMGVALVMTVSHSAWLGLALAAAILVVGRQHPRLSRKWQITSVVVATSIVAVVAPIALSRSTDVATRWGIWRDSLQVIRSRPLLGYGPDTFGLIYPRFQSGQWAGYAQIDKAHAELLQVAATQGLVGLAVMLWLVVVFAVSFWRGRTRPMAWTFFAGWAAYQAVLMVNFTALGSALPFWIFAAVSMTAWGATYERRWVLPRARLAPVAGGVAIASLVALAVPAVAMPYLADIRLREAMTAQLSSHPSEAGGLAADARALNPRESVYAVEAGNIAFAEQDWAAARAAYTDAIRLGTFNPGVYRNLAIADRSLGLRGEAIAAAEQAVYLDRFDPANQALLAQILDTAP
jgi:O-antigen ligase